MQSSFTHQELELFAKIVNEACLELGCDEAERKNVETRVLSFAAAGCRDFETLLTVATFQRDGLNSQ